MPSVPVGLIMYEKYLKASLLKAFIPKRAMDELIKLSCIKYKGSLFSLNNIGSYE